jgi:hypothetical protein
MRSTQGIAILCVGLLIAQHPYTFAQQPQASGGAQDSQKLLTPGQLDSLVAPIALYPDPILSQVLVASTYPLEVVEADRWMKSNSNLQGKALIDAAAKQPWDASVQGLVSLPEVLNRLNQDLRWTSDLGNAFLAQQQDVMEAVQRLRRKASDAGALQSTKEQTVSSTASNNQTYITIEPANPQVVYVPEYNPVAVWGPPPDYYPYPPLYYPPSTGAIVAASAISFGVGFAVGAFWGGGVGWNNWGWGCNWGRNNVVINNNFIRNNNFNRVNVGNGNSWVHNPNHRGGVPYNNRDVANRYQGNRPNPGNRPTVGQTQQRLNQAGQGRGGYTPGGQPGGRGGLAGRGGTPGQGAIAGRGGTPGQGGLAGRGGTPGQGAASRIAPGANPGQGMNRPGMPNQGNANRMAPGNQIGNRAMPNPGMANRGAFGGGNMGGQRMQMNSNRGFASRGMGGGFGGGGFRGGGGGGFRGGGGMRGGGGRRR